MRRNVRMTTAVVALLCVPATGAHGAAATDLTRTAVTIEGEAPGDQAGFQIETGDLDGDGVADLVVGAWLNDTGDEDAGAVYIEYGPITKPLSLEKADVKLYSEKPGDYVGEGPIGLVDLDDDGADDLVVGAPGSILVPVQPGSPGKLGEAFLIYGGRRLRGAQPLTKAADATFVGTQTQDWLGFGAAGVGDLDADGFEDLAIGAPGGSAYSGALYLFYGSAQRRKGTIPAGTADATIVGGRPMSLFGYEAAGGDLDGDGASDLVVAGAPFAAPQPNVVHLFYGGKRLAGMVPAAAANAHLLTVSGAEGVPALATPYLVADHDVTGDRTADLVIGDGTTGNADLTSHVYVVAGGTRRSGVARVDAAAVTTVTGTGFSVAVGDLDGDRRADLVASDPASGAVHLFRGPLKPGRLSRTAATRAYEAPAEELPGFAVAVADLTRDRRPDLVVGAPGDEAGRVYVVRSR